MLRDEQPTHVAVAFDVGRKTFRSEIFAEYKANRSESPTDFRGQVSLVQEVLAALHVPVAHGRELRGRRRHRHAHRRRRSSRAWTCSSAPATATRSSWSTTHVTVLYPRKGVSDMTRFTPEAVRDQVRPHAGAVPRLRGAARRPERQPAEHPERGGEDRGQVDPRVRLPRRAGRPGRQGEGQGRRQAARAPVLGDAEPAAHRARPRRAAATLGPADLAVQPWDRDEVHTLFDNLQFRVLRDRLFATLTSAEPEAEGGFDVADRRRAGAGGLGGWLDEHARTGRTGADLPRLLGPRHRRRSTASRWPRPTGTPRSSTRPGPRRRRRAGAGRLARRPGRAEGRARRQGPAAGHLGARLGAGGRRPATPRWPPTWRCPGSARSTSPTSRSATCAASCKDAAAEEAQLTLDGLGPSEDDVAAEAAQVDLLKSAAVKDLADALEPSSRPARRRPAAHRAGAAARPGAGRHGARAASPPTSTTCASCSASSPRASPPRPPSATRSSAAS